MSSSIAELLHAATEHLRPGSPTARLDAELLLAHVLGWSRARVLAERQHLLDAKQRQRFEELVARRAELEPVAYLVGQREFFGLEFFVDRRVLVPRPETELLVERALAIVRQRSVELIADICTGSGCIAVALAYHLPGAFVVASDLSADALAVAATNVERYRLGKRVMLLQGDLCEPLPGPVDLLVSNPPYTILDQIDAGVWRHEPHLALDGGFDGLDLYRRLLAQAPAYLRPGGAVLLEIGATQAADVVALGRTWLPQARAEVLPDLAGHDRVVVLDMGG